MTVWMTLLVTVDRYVAVCQPWRVADFRSHQRHTRLAVCLVLMFAVLYNVPRYFERQVRIYDCVTEQCGKFRYMYKIFVIFLYFTWHNETYILEH